MEAPTWIWHDGAVTAAHDFFLPGTLPGITLGWGAFETLLVASGHIYDFTAHWQRLEKSAKTLHLQLPQRTDVLAASRALVPHLASSTGRLRWTLLATENGNNDNALKTVFYASLAPYTPPSTLAQISILPFSAPHASLLSGVKTTSYAPHALAQRWAQSRGYDEALWQDAAGHIVEGTVTNVFLLHDRTLITPPLTHGCLPGITRAQVIAAARGLGWSVKEASFDLKKLLAADAVFLTSSLRGLHVVERCDEHHWSPAAAEMIKPLQQAWAQARELV
jgi:branched-chain amino acid aminotransferase